LHGENRQEYLASVLEEIEARCRAWKHQVYELGGLLCAAKRILPHGDFKPWVRDHFPLGYRTGVNCMRVFAACMNCPEMVDYIPRSCLYIMTEPQFPEDLRTVLFDNITGPVAMDRVALVLVAKKFKNGEINIDSAEVQALLKEKKAVELKERYRIELEALAALVEQRRDNIMALRKWHPSFPLITRHGELDGQDEWVEEIEQKVEGIRRELERLITNLGPRNDAPTPASTVSHQWRHKSRVRSGSKFGVVKGEKSS